jgi:hypothetical protein
VECRLGGATNDYSILVAFPINVSVTGSPQAEVIVGAGQVGSGGMSNGGTVTVSGNLVAIPLTNVISQQNIQVRLNGVNGASNNVTIPMNVLVGDINASKAVNSSDIGTVKTQSGVPVTAANFRADVAVSGSINASDIGLVKSRSGQSVP